MDAITRLRSATRSLHERLDDMPYAHSVRDGTLPVHAYAGFLRAVYEVQAALERALRGSDDAVLCQFAGEVAARRAAIDEDLTALSVDRWAVDAAVLHALVLAQHIRVRAANDSAGLLGIAYVLEGSQLGGLVQHQALSKRADLAHAIRYLAARGGGTRATFDAALERIAEALPDEHAIARAIDGATATFASFCAIFAALDPDGAEERTLAMALNDDAGTHGIPTDLREIAAALAAGESTWRSFSYYDARYGERGLAFTRSDSAWLASLARDAATTAPRQLQWLGRVLAARGMPRLLLEQHLDALFEALAHAVPAQRARYLPLRDGAATLRAQRLAVMSDGEAQDLIAEFAAERSTEASITPSEAGLLLTAAVADERNGVANAIESLTGWLASPERFSSAWATAVARLLQRARTHLSRTIDSAS